MAERKGEASSFLAGRQGLTFGAKLHRFFSKKTRPSFAAQLEEEMLQADFGVAMTEKIMRLWHSQVANPTDYGNSVKVLQTILSSLLATNSHKLVIGEQRPFCLLVIGSNGVGKTTSLAKIAYHYKNKGLKLRLVAGDTYRAAAIEQLRKWGDRIGVAVSYGKHRADSAAVIYDGIQTAINDEQDLVLVDTSGIMTSAAEMKSYINKITGVIKKLDSNAPHETLLILDATHGQNSLMQAEGFCEATKVDGFCLTKLDSSAKGGIVFALTNELQLPLRFIGTGEKLEDLVEFVPKSYLDQLFQF